MRCTAFLGICILVLSCLSTTNVSADTPNQSIPPALQPWTGWVLKGLEYRQCPFIAIKGNYPQTGDYICNWPGRLNLSATASGADFSQHWHLDSANSVVLPGDTENWPVDVTVNGRSAVVLSQESSQGKQPAIRLERGDYDIRGHIPWDHRPEGITVPVQDWLINLSVNGQHVESPELDGGYLTLGNAGAGGRQNVEVHVFRKLTDGVPAILTTDVTLDVEGPDRELTLGPALPTGFEPVNLSGDLAARFDSDGRLHVQLQSGEWTLRLVARAVKPLESVTLNEIPAPWPKQEVWSYEATPRLRITRVHGAPTIDPKQADVPDDWQTLPAFMMSKNATLTVSESSRGLATTDSNRLQINRIAWLDFDGDGIYYRDVITGDMKKGWRLDVPARDTLEYATDRNDRFLLITHGKNNETNGIEVRMPQTDITAGVHVPRIGSLTGVSSWLTSFDSVTTSLHLPYGYLLLAAPGADSARGSWMSDWTLLDVFIVAIFGVLTLRLFGRLGGVVALAYLVLGYHEPGAPIWAFALVVVLALIAKWLPSGKLSLWMTWLNRVALVALILVALPFVANQVRYAIYPQLQPASEWGEGYATRGQRAALRIPSEAERQKYSAQIATNVPTPDAISPPSPESSAMGKIEVTGTRIKRSDLVEQYQEGTVLQAGQGEPDWRLGSQYELSWSGPVTSGQTYRLLILSPWMTRLLRLVLVALLAILLVVLMRKRQDFLSNLKFPGMGGGAIAIAGTALLLGAMYPGAAHADSYPSDKLLTELRTRLTEAPKCQPTCASLSKAEVHASGGVINVRMIVGADENVAFPLLGTPKGMSLDRITMDGLAQDGVFHGNQMLYLRVPRGVHVIDLLLSTAGDGKFPLTFGIAPSWLVFSGNGWQAEGLNGHKLGTNTLTMIRVASATHHGATAVQQFPPFVELRRRFWLNLNWGVGNTVKRIAPTQGAFTVQLPLLAGEHVRSDRFAIKNDVIAIPLQSDSPSASWESSFKRTNTFTLVAPPMTNHAEIWEFVVSPTWHAEFSGIPAVEPAIHHDRDDYWLYEFHPLPGEKLTVNVTRPEPVAGSMLAIEGVDLKTTFGLRATQAMLNLDIRSTQAGDRTIELPKDAEILNVTKDNQPLNVPLKDGKLSLPITAARQSFEIDWRENSGAGFINRTPHVDLGKTAANVSITSEVPANRWMLFTFGPTTGPAVLYWGELLVMILVAFGLSRGTKTPLRFYHWLLLGLGFSTFSWTALVIVVGWILAVQWRSTWTSSRPGIKEAVQIALVFFTVLALAAIVSSIPLGLLGEPNMHIVGNGSSVELLSWFSDRTTGALPHGTFVSLPMWCYKAAMLVWAMWLAFALIDWLRWAFGAWSAGGYWPAREPKAADPVKQDKNQ